MQNALGKLPAILDLTSDQEAAAPQLMLPIHRQTAARLGITAARLDDVLYDAFGQRPISQLYTTLNQYYVILEVALISNSDQTHYNEFMSDPPIPEWSR